MDAYHELQESYLLTLAGIVPATTCIDWAIAQFDCGEEPSDPNILRLASTNNANEAINLTESILNRQIGDPILLAGRSIVLLHSLLAENKISIVQLDGVISPLYVQLGYPNWLVMLSRNCEYASDIPDFVAPFQAEFDYLTDLWSRSNSYTEFLQLYDRNISNSHDISHA